VHVSSAPAFGHRMRDLKAAITARCWAGAACC